MTRNQRTALRILASAIRGEKDHKVRGRLQVVALLLRSPVPRGEIRRRTGVAPSTAYGYLRRFEAAGIAGLRAIQSVGRPSGIPDVVRERFQSLLSIDPTTRQKIIVYVPEREQVLLHEVSRKYFPQRKISQWFRRFVGSHGLTERVRRFRHIERAHDLLPRQVQMLYPRYCPGDRGARLLAVRQLRLEAVYYCWWLDSDVIDAKRCLRRSTLP